MAWLSFVILASSAFDAITEGTSPIRIVLFVAYSLALLLAVYIVRRSTLRERLIRLLGILGFFTLGVLFILGLGLHVVVAERLSVPASSLTVFMGEGEITNNRLTHIHLLKSVTFALLAPLQEELIPSLDTGKAVLSHVPIIVVAVAAILFVFSLLALLFVGAYRVSKEARGRRMSLFLLVSLASFVSFEKAIDGGILSGGALIAYVALAAVLFLGREQRIRVLLQGALLSIVVLAILYAGGFLWGEGYALKALAQAAVLALLLLALANSNREGIRTVRSVVLLSLALGAFSLMTYAGAGQKLAYLKTVVSPEHSYSAAYPQEEILAGELIGNVGDLAVRTTDPYAGKRIGDLLAETNLAYWYQPISFHAGSCTQPSSLQIYSFELVSKERISAAQTTVPGVLALALAPIETTGAGWTRYRGLMRTHPCVPRRWDLVRESLRSVGLTELVVYGLQVREIPGEL